MSNEWLLKVFEQGNNAVFYEAFSWLCRIHWRSITTRKINWQTTATMWASKSPDKYLQQRWIIPELLQ